MMRISLCLAVFAASSYSLSLSPSSSNSQESAGALTQVDAHSLGCADSHTCNEALSMGDTDEGNGLFSGWTWETGKKQEALKNGIQSLKERLDGKKPKSNGRKYQSREEHETALKAAIAALEQQIKDLKAKHAAEYPKESKVSNAVITAFAQAANAGPTVLLE